MEIHDNYFSELNSIMQKYGFTFYRVNRGKYIRNSIKRLILNPNSS